jgi:hypothetical protein
MPRYLLLLHGDEAAETALTGDERRAIVDGHVRLLGELREAGALVASAALEPSGRTRVVRDGSVTDGPFAETKEVVGGFYVVECETDDDAVGWARRIPASPGLVVEVRPVADV